MQADASPDDRYAPPQAHVEDVPDPLQTGHPVRRSTRLWAALVDGFISAALVGLLSLVTPWNAFDLQPGPLALVTNGAIGLGLFLAVHGWLLVQRGQTVGKLLFRLRIVRLDGSKPTAAQILGLRYGVGWAIAMLPGFGWLYALVDSALIFGKERRCIHDYMAGTRVVRA